MYWGHAFFLNQQIQVAIDRRQVQMGHGGLGIGKDFLRQQGPRSLADGLGNCLALFCGALHMPILPRGPLQLQLQIHLQ